MIVESKRTGGSLDGAEWAKEAFGCSVGWLQIAGVYEQTALGYLVLPASPHP